MSQNIKNQETVNSSEVVPNEETVNSSEVVPNEETVNSSEVVHNEARGEAQDINFASGFDMIMECCDNENLLASEISPFPSCGKISRKTSLPDSSSSTSKSVIQQPLKTPDLNSKTGTINSLEIFVLGRGQVYFCYANGARYPKVAFRFLLSNNSHDQDAIGLSQFLYCSATGNHLSKLQNLKLGRVYRLFNAGFYRVSPDTAILNWRAGTYAEVQDVPIASDAFLLKFGSATVHTGKLETVGLGSFCNCVRLIFNNPNDGYISTHPACKSAGTYMPGEDFSTNPSAEDIEVEGSAGPLTSLNVTLMESNVPCHTIIHPDFAISNGDLHLDIGTQIKFSGTRFLNSSNMMFVFRIEAANKHDIVGKKDVEHDSDELENAKKEDDNSSNEELLKKEIY